MPYGTKPIRVLLVDDHQTVLWGLEKLIESEMPRMEIAGKASNREEAMAAARRLKPDVILLDLDLHGENSLEFLPDLLMQSDSKVLILTGLRNGEYRERAMMQGARGVVQKEESAEKILQAIERVHRGELWLDRATTASVFNKLSGKRTSVEHDAEAQKIATLTAREREVIAVLVEERSAHNKGMAKHLNISDHTLRNHLSSIYSKLGLENRMELYLYATEHGLAQARIANG
jgi:two-component system, NarL family, nitrate/nitrite response regulator NarL